jgi:hypothetical protein
MSVQKKAENVLNKARQLANEVPTWADFSLELFDQHSGIVARTFDDEMERQAFYDSPQYLEINQILAGLMKKVGMANGATPTREKSGRFNVRIPKTLHRSLEVEAKREGVSLNQLALCKLSLPLRHAADVDLRLLVQAFADVHDGYAIDRIVVDPDYNAKFLRCCRELGLTQTDYRLNHTLFNVRKSKKTRERLGIEIPKTTCKTEFHDFDDYQFAAEIAVRVLQRTEGVTLDRILCDPPLGAKFDEIALRLVNQTVLKLRWAALNLRKTHRLRPLDSDANEYDLVSAGPLKTIDFAALSEMPGLYAIYEAARPIFAGETENLRHRIQLHVQYGIPCVNVVEDEQLMLKTTVLPNAKQTERVHLLTDFVNREHPLLNYQRVA